MNAHYRFFSLLLFAFISGPVLAINTVDTGFQVNPDELKTIVAHGVCKKVWNTGTRAQFVATKTNPEWMNFYANHPSELVVRSCNATCSNLKKMGSAASGVYALDFDGAGPLPTMNLFCDMTSDGGGWTRVFRHNIDGGYFASLAASLNSNQNDPNHNLYSILNLLDSFKSENRLTFRLYYPQSGTRNIWSQMTNPTHDTDVWGYRGLIIDASSRYWGGLELSNRAGGVTNTNRSIIDGSVGHNDWWYAIGTTSAYGAGIPGPAIPSNDVVTEVELYVHDGGLYPMSCQHILQMGDSKGSGVYTIYPDQKNPVTTYCDMDFDGGGWTLFYANSASAAMTVKKSYNEHKDSFAGISVGPTGLADVDTNGMVNFNHLGATEVMVKDVGNWAPTDFSLIEFQNPEDTKNFLNISSVRYDGPCRNISGAGMFRFRNSKGADYWFDQMLNNGTNDNTIGWGDCHPNGTDQTDASDVENYPRDWIYNIRLATDANRVRGVGGFNAGDVNVKARYFLRTKTDRPKNCMDILLSGNSKGNGIYTIYPEGNAVTVECDMVTYGGGWTKVWHGYPAHAIYNNTTSEIYSRSNSIPFNQMRMEGVNIGVNNVDMTWKTAYLDKTIPVYFQQLAAQPDAGSPRVQFADFSGAENVGLVGNYFLKGYNNQFRIFYSCINVDRVTPDRQYLSPGYWPGCPVRNSFNTLSTGSCTDDGSLTYSYCNNTMTNTTPGTGLNLTLKQYQETRVWVRSLPSMRTCKEILEHGFSSGDGIYLIDPDGAKGPTDPFPTYCDMTTQGGGWTLVWSNTRNGTNKPITGITYTNSINTLPRCSIAGSYEADHSGKCDINRVLTTPMLERFNYFVGLKHWDDMTDGSDFELKYSWSANYGRPFDREGIALIQNFDPADKYRLMVKAYRTTIGNDNAGFINQSGMMWSTYDSDNDIYATNCASHYNNSPFWYGACWSGSINGAGEGAVASYLDGAHWYSSATQWGDPTTGLGAGNGWFFIRETKTKGRSYSSCKQILEANPGSPSGVYRITANGVSNRVLTVYCDMTTSGGGWTLVAFSNSATATAGIEANFFAAYVSLPYIGEINRPNTRASLNPEIFSLTQGTTDAMLISPSYNGGAPIIDLNVGPWHYYTEKCAGNLRHTGRTAGCGGQGANDNFDSSDAFNVAIINGNEGIVPSYPEKCYNGKGNCQFYFYLR